MGHGPDGYPLTQVEADHASLWLRVSACQDEDDWGWHPVQIERTANARAVLAVWPGRVCRLCYEDAPLTDVP